MNSKDFLEEVLTSDICPEGFEDLYLRFQSYQRYALETLKEVHRLCEENGIRYQLAYGSLIGAIRDKGQIPWDYDVDIFIPYEDKNKMLDVLKNDLNSKFYAYCPEIDPACDHTLMRISPVGFHSDAIHVDVFYVMALSNDIEERISAISNINILFSARAVKKANIFLEARRSKRLALRGLSKKIKYLFISQKRAEEEYDRRCRQYRLEETDYCAPATIDGEKCIYLTKNLWNTEIVELPTGAFRITKDYDKTLRQYYGDYMKIPPLEDRLRELRGSLMKIEYYCKASASDC